MANSYTSRPARFAGRVLVAVLLLAPAACFAAPVGPDELLHSADQIKLANNDEFRVQLKQLDAQASLLTVPQRDWLDYLHAWQLGYQGDYPQALSAFGILLAHTQDPTVRARVRISLIYDQANAAHYEDAYTNLSVLLDSLPQIQDRTAHFLSLNGAAILYSQAGQYDMALRYIDQSLAYDHSDRSTCTALTTKAETLYKSGKLRTDNAQIRSGLDACQRIGDPIYTNIIRLWIAKAQMEQGDVAGALQLLKAHDAEVQATHSSALNSLFRATLAKCSLLTGDLAHASEYASSAIDYANKQVNSQASADAWQVLYQVAKQQGDDTNALAYHEKYAAADKGFLNDTSARSLAYQMVHQQVQAKKLEIDALSKQNQLLQLRQAVSKKTAEMRGLSLALLLTVLAFIAMWGYKTKRSQLRFMKMARRDGLTGLFNRQHFIDAAETVLQYCRESSRDACVILIDLDHFKLVNDVHGHAAGDAILKRAAMVCQALLRSIDVFGRLGGEEFGILLPDCTPENAQQKAEQLRLAIAALSSDESGEGFPVSASFGVSATRCSGYGLRLLLGHADSALYQAKHDGRNRVILSEYVAGAADELLHGKLDRKRG